MENEIKPGQTVEMRVGDKTIAIEPVPFGNVKKVFRIIAETIGDFSKEQEEAIIMRVPRIMEEKVGVILPLLFWPGKYPFINQDFIDNHLTVIDIRKIVETAIVVNGFTDFLAKLGNRLTPAPQASEEPSIVKPTVS